jgi:hypothetical protein
MERSQVITARVAKLTNGFARYVQAYDDRVSFTSTQLAAHRACLDLRHEAGSVAAAVHDERFVRALRQTLRAWKVGIRAGRLVQEEDFAAALQAALPQLQALEGFAIDAADLPDDIGERLWSLIEALGIIENKAKIVAGTKALHHLLPDLVVPMDRIWTGSFFGFHDPQWQDARSQRRIFTLAYGHFAAVARQVQPQRYVTGQGWLTCRTKILDNALIGFCKAELGTVSLDDEGLGNEITVEAQGLPPAKDGANSIFKAGHGHGVRVRALLEAAARALEERAAFEPVKDGPVAMEVLLYAPAGGVPGDATNYLGGIADVLEQKDQRVAIEHLGALAQVWLYGNDRQIKQVSYREVAADQIGYRITVRPL